jgi:hypothetical protein
MTDVYCRGPECDRPAFRGELCEAHTKQQQRTGKLTPIAEKLTPEQRAFEAGNAMLEWDGDDAGFERLRRAYILACKVLGRKAHDDAVAKGRTAARARGVHMGRPPRVSDEELVHAYEVSRGNVSQTARYLRMAVSSVYERLLRKGLLPERRARPRLTA